MKQPSILIVDDDPVNYELIKGILKSEPYILQFVSSGREALSELDTLRPDLILMDVLMPEMDGIETCQRIKSIPRWQSVPILMVTGLSAQDYMVKCIEAGADDFLSKPVNPVELRARIHSMLRIKQQYDSIKALSHLQANTIDVLHDSLDALRLNLVASLPHELNTPLSGIAGIIAVLLDQHGSMEFDEAHRFLELAQQSVSLLEKFIQRFLVYFELEMSTLGGDDRPSVASSPVLTYARPIIETCARRRASDSGREQDLLFSADDVVVMASAKDLLLITEELLDNAFKFSRPGTLVKLVCTSEGPYLHIAVSDQGRGMTTEQIEKIGAFMQFDRKQYAQPGTGLGLAIVKKIAETRGGTFSIESLYHEATTIHIKLPCAE